MLLFDFTCAKGHTTERLVNSSAMDIVCDCGATAHRVISAPRLKIDPISGDFPGATMKWEKMRAKQIQHERKTSGE